MKHIELLNYYNEIPIENKNYKADVRTQLLKAMYEELPDFKVNHRVKVLLNEELSHYRKAKKNNDFINARELSIPFTLFRFLVENAENPEYLKNDLKKEEALDIVDKLALFMPIEERALLDYFMQNFATVKNEDHIQSILYFSLQLINNNVPVSGSMSLTVYPRSKALHQLSISDKEKLTQSDSIFAYTNEKGFEFLQSNQSLEAAIGLFILNFEKGNKGFSVFYLQKLYECLNQDSLLIPLLKVIEKEFLQ